MVAITTGFSVSRHFCHNRLVDTEFFSEPRSCHESRESCCEGKEVFQCSKDIDQDDCCKNENALVKFTEQFTVSQKQNPDEQTLSIFSFCIHDFYRSLLNAPSTQGGQLLIAQPPPLSLNILTFIQSFLI
jgi:hypothetical protein